MAPTIISHKVEFKLSEKALWIVSIVLGAGLFVLLIYSLDRTSWIFQIFETGQPQAEWLGRAAAIVIEIAAIAIIAGEAVADLLPEQHKRTILRWAHWCLASIVGAQAIANFIAGYIRGGSIIFDKIGERADLSTWQWASAYAVQAVAWFLINGIIPFLILGLAKMEAVVIRLLIESRQSSPLQVSTLTTLPAAEESNPTANSQPDTQTPTAQPIPTPQPAPKPTPTRPTPSPLDDFLARLGYSREQAKAMFVKYGLDKDPTKAYNACKGYNMLPPNMPYENFHSLFTELIGSPNGHQPPPEDLLRTTKQIRYKVKLTKPT